MPEKRNKRVDVIVNGRLNRRAPRRVRDIADALWTWAVKYDWSGTCAMCGKRGTVAHHIIHREFYRFRFELINGVCLCVHDHLYNPAQSPHANAAGWLKWLQEEHRTLYRWYMDTTESGAHFIDIDLCPIEYYCGKIMALREHVLETDFRRIVGASFADYLSEHYQ